MSIWFNICQNYLDKNYNSLQKISIINSKKFTIIPIYPPIKKIYYFYLDHFNETLKLRINNLSKKILNLSPIKLFFVLNNNCIIFNVEGKKYKAYIDKNLNKIYLEEKGNQYCKIMVNNLNGKVEYYNGEKDNEYKEMAIYSDKTTEFYQGQKGQEHLVKINYPDDKTKFYEGQKGEEHLVKIEYPDVKTEFYEGQKGHEYLVRQEYGNITTFYKGEKGKERFITRQDSDCNITTFYKGEKGKERFIRKEDSLGNIVFYDGEKDKEHLVKIKFNNGNITFYQGEVNQEHIVKKEFNNGNIAFYDGEKDKEHLVKIKFNNGDITFYQGEVNQERMAKKEFNNGNVLFYEGEKNLEHIIRAEKDDEKLFFTGKKDQEYLTRIEKNNSEIIFFNGSKDQEYKVMMINSEKDKIYFNGKKDEEYIVEIIKQDRTHKFFETIYVPSLDELTQSLAVFKNVNQNEIQQFLKFKKLGIDIDLNKKKKRECLRKIKYPDGKVEVYDGYKDQEYLTQIIYSSEKKFYKGKKNNERLVNKILENGTEEFYKGLKDQEYKVKTKFPNNEIHYFRGYKDDETLTKIIYSNGEEKIFNSKSIVLKKDSKSNITNQQVEYSPPEIPKYSSEVKKELDRKRFERRNGLYSDQDKVNSIDSSFITQGHNKKLNPREKYSSNDQYKRKSLFLIQKEENSEECSCPTCSSVITRVNYNNHLKCLNCKTQFCFLCRILLINHLEKKTRKPHFSLYSKCPQHGNIGNVDN